MKTETRFYWFTDLLFQQQVSFLPFIKQIVWKEECPWLLTRDRDYTPVTTWRENCVLGHVITLKHHFLGWHESKPFFHFSYLSRKIEKWKIDKHQSYFFIFLILVENGKMKNCYTSKPFFHFSDLSRKIEKWKIDRHFYFSNLSRKIEKWNNGQNKTKNSFSYFFSKIERWQNVAANWCYLLFHFSNLCRKTESWKTYQKVAFLGPCTVRPIQFFIFFTEIEKSILVYFNCLMFILK